MSENDKYLEAFPLKLETETSNMNENVSDLILLGAKLDKHESVCEERYTRVRNEFQAINARLKRIETVMITTAGATIILLGGILLNG